MVVLWQCLAALEDLLEKGGSAEQVYMEALDKCGGDAELSYGTARFYLEQVGQQPRLLLAFGVHCTLNHM